RRRTQNALIAHLHAELREKALQPSLPHATLIRGHVEQNQKLTFLLVRISRAHVIAEGLQAKLREWGSRSGDDHELGIIGNLAIRRGEGKRLDFDIAFLQPIFQYSCTNINARRVHVLQVQLAVSLREVNQRFLSALLEEVQLSHEDVLALELETLLIIGTGLTEAVRV